MRKVTTERSAWGGIAGFVALMGFGGCMADVGPEHPPRMPTVLPAEGAVPPPAVAERDVLARALAAAERENSEEILNALRTLPESVRAGVGRELFADLVRRDLGKAGRMAQTMPPGPFLTDATMIAARAMVERDPVLALAWALATVSPSVDFATRQAVAEEWVGRDSRNALERLLARPAGSGRDELLGYAAAAWVRRDATTALAWARELPRGDDRTRVLTSMSFALAQIEPERAAELTNLLPEGRDRWLLIGAIGQTWIARDAKHAWAWARQLPPGEAREAARAGIETGLGAARSHRGVERVAVAERIQGGGGGTMGPAAVAGPVFPPDREQVLRREFEDALRESPARAATWLADHPPAERRDEMIDEVARRWLAINPAAAKIWLDQNLVLPDRQAQLIREAGR